MQCDYFDDGRCRSCTLMSVPYPTQVDRKQRDCEAILAPLGVADWRLPVTSRWREL